jgi:hypothetical protein
VLIAKTHGLDFKAGREGIDVWLGRGGKGCLEAYPGMVDSSFASFIIIIIIIIIIIMGSFIHSLVTQRW